MNTASGIRRLAIGVTVVLLLGVAIGAGYEQVARRRARQAHPLPGRQVMVDDTRRLQLDCRGTGSPTVVFESGLDTYGSLSWSAVHDSIAATTRSCAYSRAGLMWSEPAARPFASQRAANDLHAALREAGEDGPLVLVGHSLGVPYIMTYRAKYPHQVVGLVFLDGTHPEQFERFRAVVGQSLLPTSGAMRTGARLAWTGLLRVLVRPESVAGWQSQVEEVAARFLPTSVAALAREVEAIPATLQEASRATDLGNLPLVVLTAGRAQPASALQAMGLTTEQGVLLQEAAHAMQLEQSRWSSRGRQQVVPMAAHYIQFDAPQAVIAAVREVVAAADTNQRVTQTPMAHR